MNLIFLSNFFVCFYHAGGESLNVEFKSASGTNNLKLTKTAESVLHPDIHFTTIKTNKGKVFHEIWKPSQEERRSAEDVYLNQHHLAVVRKSHTGELSGVVNGQVITEVDGTHKLVQPEATGNRSDYVEIGRNLTFTGSGANIKADLKGDVELLVVLDKEMGDRFGHDLVKILDYLTVYFWDINLRYQTLRSVDLNFRITHVVAIADVEGQPFIEEARGPDGRAEFGRILFRFAGWVYDQMNEFPKFDMAVLITSTSLEWAGGLAHMSAACGVDHNAKRHWGTGVFSDAGNWGSLTIGAHEIAHSLGAPHDDEPNYPGGCDDRGFIMGGATDELRWFFSPCSDRTISNFVRSDQGSCLRQIDQPGNLPISPDFSSVKAPDMDLQCKLHAGPTAFIDELDTINCKHMRCLVPFDNGGGWWVYFIAPVDNTLCLGGGRCFRGRCLKEGVLMQNVESGRCLYKPERFNPGFTAIEMVECNRLATPLEKLIIMDGPDPSSPKMLAIPYQTPNASENADACIWTGNVEGNWLMTDRCDTQNPWHGWDFVDVGNNEIIIKHRVTQRCAKQNGNIVETFTNCNPDDRSRRWKIL